MGKELSIEEKAKAYDKALEVLHKYDGANIMFSQSLKEEMFPKLKESEDERIREALIDIVKYAYKKGVIILREKEKEKYIAWLEKQGQKPVWSEEDKNMLEWVIEYLNNRMLNTPISEERTACKNAIAWLKSLRPQSTWRPSDEQIHYLSWIANVKLGDSVVEQEVSKHLNELLEDLKKLRKE